MDLEEIINIFQVSQDTEYSEGVANMSSSENGDCSSQDADEDDKDTNNEGFGCNFDEETAMDSMADIEKINFKEISSEEIMRYHFPDREVAFMFYNWYGCLHGFAGRKSRVVRNVGGEIIQQTFICHREGTRDDKYSKSVSRRREHKPTSRCGCEAKMQVHLDINSECWYIKFFDDVHNHSFLDNKYEGMLPAHRKMSEYEKYQMKTMRKSGIPTTRIYGYFAAQAGGYENVGYSRRDVYNEQFKQRGSKSSDADGALDFLKGLCSKDEMMYWRHTINEDGTLQHLF